MFQRAVEESDLNYIITVTCDRRKQTQLCHVKMLKPYAERIGTLTVHPVSVNVANSESEELVVNNPSDNFSLPGTAKLKNSLTDVLGIWTPSCPICHHQNASTGGIFYKSTSTCFQMSQPSFMMWMLVMQHQWNSTLTG